MTLSDEARSFNWLLNGFVEKTAGVTDAVAVSSDGLLMAMSSSLDPGQRRAARRHHLGARQPRATAPSTLLRLRRPRAGHRDDAPRASCSCRRSPTAAASASCRQRGCDIGLVGYQTTLLVERAGTVLTPALVAELKQEMLVS